MKRVRGMLRSGEPFVWLTSLGLALGLVMIFGLLWVIFDHGIRVFWPRRVVELTLVPGSKAGFEDNATFGGEVVKVEENLHSARQKHPDQPVEEWQIYAANRDIYGFSFKYVDRDQIASVRYPKDAISIDRRHASKAIGIPVALKTANGPLSATSPGFATALSHGVDDVNARWDEINHLEDDEIGSINARIKSLQLQRKSLMESHAAGPELDAKLAELEQRSKALTAQYEKLAAHDRALRARQNADGFVYRTLSGQQQTIPLGEVMHYYYANRLSLVGRARLFLYNLRVFVSQDPREANTEGGIFPALFGTFAMTLLLSVFVMPFGVLSAIYLREYARQGLFVRIVRIAVNNLAGVPSIVFGVFGLGFLIYVVGGTIDSVFFANRLPTATFGTGGILWASLTLALLTVPVVIVSTEEGLAAVPRGMREASLACGASKWQTVQRVVLPAASPGMLKGLILAMARGAGEVAPLMLVGVVKSAPTLPFDSQFPFIHLQRKFMHLGFHIFDLGFQSPDSEAAKPMVFATTLLLILLVVVLNLAAIIIRERLRRKYTTGAF